MVAWDAEFRYVCTRAGLLFYGKDSRAHAVQSLRGLLAPLERKNGWTIAEYAGLYEPKALQRVLNLTPRDSARLRGLLRDYAMVHFYDPLPALIASPTGFAQKGRPPARVPRPDAATR